MSLNYSQLPSWLENNRAFRFLFLLRKLYLTRTRFGHHGSAAEDISIVRLFDKSHRGFFVDVGCFHPKKYSNTWLLYKRGWRGINIDIDPIKIDGFNLVRPHDVNIACAVSNTEGEISYYSSGFYSLTITLDEAHARGKAGYVKRTTQCAKLTHLIDGTRFKDREIDLLSVDVEGHDLEVLRSLDFGRYHPRLIAVETQGTLFPEVERSPLYEFLLSKQYCLVGWCGITLLMASKSLQRTLARSSE